MRLHHSDAVERVGCFHRALLVRHDEQLRFVAELIDKVRNVAS